MFTFLPSTCSTRILTKSNNFFVFSGVSFTIGGKVVSSLFGFFVCVAFLRIAKPELASIPAYDTVFYYFRSNDSLFFCLVFIC